jgi:TonB family protein
MQNNFLSNLLIYIVLMTAAQAHAQQTPQPPSGPDIVKPTAIPSEECKQPKYPPSAIQSAEMGVVLLGFLISEKGDVEQATVLNSSGVKALDQGALIPMSKCPMSPGTLNGKPVAMWISYEYTWSLGDGDDDDELVPYLAMKVHVGNIPAYYSLYYALSQKTGKGAEAQKILIAGAAKGNLPAQYTLARQFAGQIPGFPVDNEKAKYWMGKAAASGYVMAKQALEFYPDLYAPKVQ